MASPSCSTAAAAAAAEDADVVDWLLFVCGFAACICCDGDVEAIEEEAEESL